MNSMNVFTIDIALKLTKDIFDLKDLYEQEKYLKNRNLINEEGLDQ